MILAACQTPLPPPVPAIRVQRVEVLVPVRCKPDLGAEPEYVTAAEFMNAMDILAAVRLYKADRNLRIKRDGEKDAAIKKCANE